MSVPPTCCSNYGVTYCCDQASTAIHAHAASEGTISVMRWARRAPATCACSMPPATHQASHHRKCQIASAIP
eukprot:364410-Chlamydomonas_euryale.AAC.15